MPSAPPVRLLTIPFSHYCEKARWALDHTGIPYVEEAYLPGRHFRPVRDAGGKTVPVLVTPEGPVTDSADIVLWCDAHAPADRKLYPTDPAARAEVEAIEALCNRPLGVSSRLLAYHHLLPTPGLLLEVVRPSLTGVQAFFFPFVMRLVRPLIRRRYRVDDAHAAEAMETVRRVFAEVGARLGSRAWLVGDRMSAADLTFASLAAPVVAPEGHPATSAAVEPKGALRSLILEFRATPAGQHAQRVYRTQRNARGLRHAKIA
jgi:glutathione S-transferase